MKIINKTDFCLPKNLEKKFDDIYKEIQVRFNLNKSWSVEVGVIDLEEMHDLNKEYRGKDEPTDVLSFPLNPEHYETCLGSIYFCHQVISSRYEDVRFGFCFLFVHGLLHLLGYEHGTEMFNIQNEIVELLLY